MKPEDLYVISDEALGRLRDLHRRRDEQAFIAGCALLEAEERKLDLMEHCTDSQERATRLGALLVALSEATEECFRKVRTSKLDEQALGEGLFALFGLNPKEELTIDINNGAVLVLTTGAWVPKLRSPT